MRQLFAALTTGSKEILHPWPSLFLGNLARWDLVRDDRGALAQCASKSAFTSSHFAWIASASGRYQTFKRLFS